MIKFTIVMGTAIFDILFHSKTKTDQHGGVDGAIRSDHDLCGLRQMLEDMRLGLVESGNVQEIGLGQHDKVGAGDLIFETSSTGSS